MFGLSWLRSRMKSYVRSKTAYMDPGYAARTKNKLALVYTLAVWNLFGIIIAYAYREKIPKTHDSYDYAKVFGIKDAHVIRFSGFKKVDEYDLKLSDQELDEFKQTVGDKEAMEKYEQKNEERIKASLEGIIKATTST